MRRVLVVAASSLALAACSDIGKMPDFSMPNMDLSSKLSPPGAAATLAFESEPSGAEVRTSSGQTCRTPCSLSVPSSDFSATFSAPGYQAQTVPVKLVATTASADPELAETQVYRLSPNPVYAELQAAAPTRRPAPATASPTPTPKKKKTTAKPKPAASSEPMTAAPSSAPASPWPTPAPSR